MEEQMSDIEERNGYCVHRYGQENEPIVIIDNFFSEPEKLVQDAKSQTFDLPSPYYPGIRASAPARYLLERGDILEEIFRDIFGYPGKATLDGCFYSLVTTRPESLQPIQSLPHHDSCDGNRIAMLHYLSGP